MSLASHYAYFVLIKDILEKPKPLWFPSLKAASLHLGVSLHMLNKSIKPN